MRTRGTFAATRAGSMTVARKSKRRGHFRGVLAVATFPSELSTRAYARSPSSPRSVTSVAFSSSPIMDLTGYRQSETTEPSSFCTAFDILHLLRQLGTRLSSPRHTERYDQEALAPVEQFIRRSLRALCCIESYEVRRYEPAEK